MVDQQHTPGPWYWAFRMADWRYAVQRETGRPFNRVSFLLSEDGSVALFKTSKEAEAAIAKATGGAP